VWGNAASFRFAPKNHARLTVELIDQPYLCHFVIFQDIILQKEPKRFARVEKLAYIFRPQDYPKPVGW
jgi:hypothetical protein